MNIWPNLMASSCNMKISGKYKKWKEGEYALHV